MGGTFSTSTVTQREPAFTALRWGIAGTGRMASDFITAIRTLDSAAHHITAVAARSDSAAQKFASAKGIETAYSNYEELAQDPDIDVVYIATVPSSHYELVRTMLLYRKSVLCEKPLSLSLHQTADLVRLARSKQVFCMEGMWARCLPIYRELLQKISDGEIGSLRKIIVNLGFWAGRTDGVLRRSTGQEGSIEAISLCLQFVSSLMQGEKPVQVLSKGRVDGQGFDVSSSSQLLYSSGRQVEIETDLQSSLPCQAIVIGTSGAIKVHYPFWCPTDLDTPEGRVSLPLQWKWTNYKNSIGIAHQIEEVARCLHEGLLESSSGPLEDSLINAEIADEIRRQIGVEIFE